MKLNYGFIFSFPNKPRFDDSSNICTKPLIMDQKIINNCPSYMLISFEVKLLNVAIIWAFTVRPGVTSNLAAWVTSELQYITYYIGVTIYYIGNVFMYNKMKVPFSSPMVRYFVKIVFCNVHETKRFLQLSLNALFCKKVLVLFLGLFALSIILLLSSPVFQHPLLSLYMTRPLLQKRQTPGQTKQNYHLKLLFDTCRLLCSPDDSSTRISVKFL